MLDQLVQENRTILSRFARLIRNKRLAHAYLFAGPDGTGKGPTALSVAKMLNCEANRDQTKDEPCGRCENCRRIDAGNFPDVTVIDSGEETSIKIARVRELIGRMQLKPYEAKMKIFIIRKIEDLTLEGSNALLKTLEEPSPDSLLLLTTAVLEKNLGTIRSRCHAVYFFAQEQNRLEDALGRTAGLDPAGARFLASYAEGYPARARWLNEQGLLERKNEIITRLLSRRDTKSFLKAVLADKERTKEALDVLLTWFRDASFLRAGAGEEHLMHADRLPELSKISKRYTFGQMQDIIGEIVRSEKMLGENFNIKISMQLLMEKIWRK